MIFITTALLLVGLAGTRTISAWVQPNPRLMIHSSQHRVAHTALASSLWTDKSSLSSTDSSTSPHVTRDTYSHDDWVKGFHTVESERCYEVPLDDSFPSDSIAGTFFQNGHAKFKVGEELIMHPFDADGMVTALTFRDGKAWFRNRFVRTPGYKEELEKSKVCYRGMFGTAKNNGAWYSNIFDIRMKNVANTHVLFNNNKLYALWEGGKPFELDPITLETTCDDAVDLNGTLEPSENYAAHYKIDPDSGNIVNFAISVTGTSSLNPNDAHLFTMYEHDSALNLISKRKFELPGFGLAHDVAMSKSYLCTIQAPAKFDAMPFLLGKKGVAECISMDDETNHSKMHLLPRSGPLVPITIDIPLCFTFHLSNAFEEEDGTFVVDAVMADELRMADTESNAYPERPLWETFDMSVNRYQLRRYRIDIANRKVISITSMTDDASANVEFPVINPNFVTKPYQYCYIPSGASRVTGQPIQGISKIDVTEGKTLEKWLPSSDSEFLGEPCFVAGKNGKNEEDDGYLLAYLMNGKEETTTLCVFDCKDIKSGPISQTAIPTFLSHALHGIFVPGYEPDFAAAEASFQTI